MQNDNKISIKNDLQERRIIIKMERKLGAILVVFSSINLWIGAEVFTGDELFIKLILAGAFLAMFYPGLVFLLNQTTIQLDQRKLNVNYGPLPLIPIGPFLGMRPKNVQRSALKELRLEAVERTNNKGRSFTTHAIIAEDNMGKTTEIYTNTRERYSLKVEQAIRSYWNL